MKKILTIITGVFLFGILLTSISCTKGWEELNVSPNDPTEVPATNVLANTLQGFAFDYFDAWFNMNNTATYAGHLGKIQYIDESRYQERESVINGRFNAVYRMIKDIQTVKSIAREKGNMNMVAVAMTFEAYMFQIVTDSWRDVPYFEAGMGDNGVLKPVYDTQEIIYPAILDSLAAANAIFNEGHLDALGSGDLLYGGSKANWQKFCNSLRLRMANRVAEVHTPAQGIIEGILGDFDNNPIMETNADNAFLYFPGAAPYKEPWFADSETRDDHAIGSYLLDEMVALGDPRLSVYAKPASDAAYRGVIPGIADDNILNISMYSRIGARFRDDATGFVPYMRCAEVKFIIAEAAQNGYANTPDAQTAFVDAVKMSLDENGITDDTYAEGLTVSLTTIYQQKWISLFKDGHEAWAECRRTDYPVMPMAPGAEDAGAHQRPPFRFSYSTDEVNLNGAHVQPYLDLTVDKFWGQKMWWDTRSVN